jgi:hypothetical protein
MEKIHTWIRIFMAGFMDFTGPEKISPTMYKKTIWYLSEYIYIYKKYTLREK